MVDFDIHDDTITPTVYERYAEMRQQCPVAWTAHHGGHWIVSRYADIHEICRRPEVFSNNPVAIPPPAPSGT
ncbi:MAG: hypothetical protein ACRDY7_03710 [Acidimicrobiia bacterium]